MIRTILPTLLLCLASTFASAAEDQSLTLPNGDEVPATRYPAEGKRLLLWLPSKFGLSPRQAATANGLAEQGIEVWIPDLHSAWFVPPGRYSPNDIDPAAIKSLIDTLAKQGKSVFILSAGRTTTLALRALRRYQLDHRNTTPIRGLISIGPRLFLHTPQGGEAAEFLPIASASNVPIYILQPRNTGSFWRIGKVVQELERGGAPVFTQVLDGVRDGFNLRSEFTRQELTTTRRLPGILAHTMDLLDGYGGLPAQAAPWPGKTLPPRPATPPPCCEATPARARLPRCDSRSWTAVHSTWPHSKARWCWSTSGPPGAHPA